MKWLTLVVALLVVAIVIAADRGQLPAFVIALYAFPSGDKVGHFAIFGALAFLLNMSLPLSPASRPWLSLVIGTIVLAALIAAEELSQSLFAGRHASWADLASSYAGIVCLSCLAWVVRRALNARRV